MKKLLLVVLLSFVTFSVYANESIGEACLTCVGTPAPQNDVSHVAKHHFVHKRPAKKH